MKEKRIKRPQTIGEEIANSVSHGVMALFGIYALIVMLIRVNQYSGEQFGWALLAVIVFGVSIILLYTSSTLYHALAFTKSKGIFKRFDHLSIYMLIGGTFAPTLLLLPALRQVPFLGIPNFLDAGLTLFLIQWTLIITGMVMKSIWVYKYQTLHIAIFLLIGWSAVMFISDLYVFSISATLLILFGGLSYTIGVVFYALSNKKYFHFIWHIFVALGTILQFLAIYIYLIP